MGTHLARTNEKKEKPFELSKTKRWSASSSSSAAKAEASSDQLLEQHWGKHWDADTSSNGKGGSRRRAKIPHRNPRASSKAVWAGRILFVCVLLTLACSIGVLAFKLLTEAEASLAETQFRSICDRALIQAKEGLLSRRWAGVTLATFVGDLYPNADQWPFVEWLGFEHVVNSMLETSRGNDMGFVPFVEPSILPEFETFAQGVYQKLDFPNDTAVSDWGFGVWGRNTSVTPVQKYHDTTAATPYNSSYEILAPIFRTDEGSHKVLLFNVHSQKFTGEAIDKLIDCSDKRKEKYHEQREMENTTTTATNSTNELPTIPPHECGVITDIFYNVKLGGRWSVANFLPIYPGNDPLKVVGYIPSIFIVDELLTNVFASEITGVDAVFETEAMSVSYTIINGEAHYTGEGKLYDRKYENLKQSIQLADADLYTNGADGKPHLFRFTLTPNDDFYDVYQTAGPIVATVVVLGSILLTISVFFLYDFFVRREFNAKGELLEARRQFMRFVSHEVRTPLNAVSMGLDLMQSEIAQDLGFDSPTCLKSSIETRQKLVKTISKLTLITEDMDDREAKTVASPVSTSPKTLGGLFSPLNTAPALNSTNTGVDEMATIPVKKAENWFQLSQEIQSNAQGAVDILNDLLNYDKIEQGKLQLGLEVLSMWQLLEKAVMEFKLPASHKQVDLSVSFGVEDKDTDEDDRSEDSRGSSFRLRPRDLPKDIRHLKVVGDSVRLTQVLRNLMSNALKFTPAEGSVHVQALYVSRDIASLSSSPGETTERSSSFTDRSNLKSADNNLKRVEREFELQEGEIVTGLTHGYVKIQVTDTGAGMSRDQIAKLFQDGVQFNVNELQAGGGSGLGLYIAKGIVKQHSGFLTASSQGLGHGTTFELILPLWKIPTTDVESPLDSSFGGSSRRQIAVNARDWSNRSPTDLDMTGMGSEDFIFHTDDDEKDLTNLPPPSPAQVHAAESTLKKNKKKVLVVDDVKSNRKLLIRLLENNGHQCDEAENGQQALDLFVTAKSSGTPYDSILLDHEMPVMDGPTAAKEIRQTLMDDHVNIVGVTGNVLPDDVRFFKSCGANDVLAKPVKVSDVFTSWAEYGL